MIQVRWVGNAVAASYDEREYAETRAREARVAERVLARELCALQGREPEPQNRPWDTAGQCQGRTRLGERCRVHRSSPYAVAAPLRRGEQFCGHHHPDKYTGVRCAGIKNAWRPSCQPRLETHLAVWGSGEGPEARAMVLTWSSS